MKKTLLVLMTILFYLKIPSVFAEQEVQNQDFIDKYYFDVDLKGVKDIYFFREFPFYNDKGQISSLGKAVLSVLQGDIWTWVREPRIYVKNNMAYGIYTRSQIRWIKSVIYIKKGKYRLENR